MKKTRIRFLAAAVLSVLLLCSGCARPGHTNPSESENTDSETTSPTRETETPAVPTEPVETGGALLPPPGNGVWICEDEHALAQAADEIANSSEDTCAVYLTHSFSFTSLVVFDRPISLYYLPEQVSDIEEGTGILIETRKTGQITVSAASPNLLKSGLLTVNAPFCTLSWEGDALPSEDDVKRFCNTLSTSEMPDLGGAGAAGIQDIRLICSDTGKPYEDSEIFVRGNVITLRYPLLVSDRDLIQATLLCTTDGRIEAQTYDLRCENRLTVTDPSGEERTYLLCAERIAYSVPIMRIETENEQNITSKTEYVAGTLYFDGVAYPLQIKGRGNASWSSFPKKAYRLKLDSSASFFGLSKSRNWVLVSNYADKSLIRNEVATAIASELDGLAFSPVHVSVNLYLNGEYLGVYGFAEKIESGKGRVDLSEDEEEESSAFPPDPLIGDIGFLCEVGWDYESENIKNRDYFDTEKILRVYVKEPDIYVRNQAELVYVREYLLATERAIAKDDGWLDYIDLDSFVDWFLVTEMTFNTESVFYRSCYFYKPAGGKLRLGPIWDADMAFGNHMGDIPNYNGWCTTEATYYEIEENWFDDLIRYPVFREAVKKRWEEVGEQMLQAGLKAIDEGEARLSGSWEQNFKRWDILEKQIGLGAVDPSKYGTYEGQIQYLRDFLTKRFAYMDQRIRTEF